MFDFAARQLVSRYNLDLRAARLDYNLLTRRVTLTDVRLAARGHEQDPFVTAGRVEVTLPWSVFRGLLAFNHIEFERVVVSMHRYEDGSSNLPAGGGTRDPGRPPLRLNVAAVAINGLDFSYVDQVRGMQIAATDLHADLEPGRIDGLPGASGPLEIRQGIRLTFGDRAIVGEAISGLMAFDGSTVALQDVGLTTAEGNLVIGGRVERAMDGPALDLQFTGTVDVARAAAWGVVPVMLGGTSALSGRVSGPAASPTITIQTSSDDLVVGRITDVSQTSQVTVTTSSVVIDKSSVTIGAGTVDVAATVPFGGTEPLKATASWRTLDARTLFGVFDAPDRPIAASLTGTLQFERTGDGPITLRVSNASAPLSSSNAVPIRGDLALQVSDGRFVVQQQHAIPGVLSLSGDLGGNLAGSDFARATIDAKLDVAVEDIATASSAIDRLGLELPAITDSIHGPLQAAVTLGGRLDALETSSRVESSALKLPTLGAVALQAQVDTNPSSVRVSDVAAAVGGVKATGYAGIDLTSRALSGAFELNAPELGELVTELPAGLVLSGPLTATATLEGTTAEPLVPIEARGEGLEVNGQPIDSLVAIGRVTGDSLDIESFQIRQREGELSGSGSYTWGAGAYTADIQGSNLSWSGPLVGSAVTTVRVTTATFAGAGTIDEPGGEARAAFEIMGGDAGTLVGEGTATARLGDGVAKVIAQIPVLGAYVEGQIATRAPFAYDATAVVNRLDVGALAPLAGVPDGIIDGHLSLSATTSGTVSDAASSRVQVNLQEIQATVSEVPIVMAAPSTLSWQDPTFTVDELNLQVGKGRLLATGALTRAGAARWDASFDGELDDLVRISHAFGAPKELAATGQVKAQWQSTGGLAASTGTVQVSGGTVAWAELPPVTAVALQAAFDSENVDVTTLSGAWQDGGIKGTARIPRALLDESAPRGSGPPGRVDFGVTNLPVAAFEPWIGQEALTNIHGQLSASLTADIASPAIEDVRATFLLDQAAFTVSALELVQQRPSRLTLDHGVVTFEDVAWVASGSPVFVTGTVTVAPEAARSLNLALVGNLDLRMLSAFTPTLATEGAGAVNVWADGPLTEPRFTGRIELKDAGLAIREPRVVIGQMNGPIVLDGTGISFQGVSGTANGGDLTLDGRLTLDAGSISGGHVVMQFSGAALEFPENLQSELSGLVTLTPVGDEWLIGGDVRVERSSFTEAFSLAGMVATRRAPAPVASRTGPSVGDRLRLNLFVVTGEDLRIDNNYGRIEAGAAVRLVGTVANPAVTGRVTLREGGQVFLAGNTFFLERGSVTFTSTTRIQPELDIQARGVAGGTDMRLTISGPVDRLQTDVSATDPSSGMSDQEVRAALMGGLVGDQQLLTLLSGELLGITGRALGLSALRLDTNFEADQLRFDPTLVATETDPTTRLTLSKQVNANLEIILSQSLTESGALTAIISYKPRRNIEVRATSRDNIDRSIAVRHEITFGGAGTPTIQARVQPIVSSVTIVGAPADSETQIRSDLRIDEGDRFDFHRWQRDVDDIRKRFIEQGYFEVRVRATREESPDQETVALTHAIEVGPRTRLVIEGHPLHENLVEELEEAWTRIIFDQFLVDEFENRIRRHLLAENWIGSTVEAQVTVSTPEDKEVRVAVSPGVQVSDRTIRWAGRQSIEEDRLDAAVIAAGLPIDGWLDPPLIANAIEAYYREHGFLSIKAATGEPIVEGDTGVLVVLLEEGPRYTVAAIDVPGSARERPFVAEALKSITIGAPYERAMVEQTAVEIESLYLRRGYNDVRVQAQADVNADGAATVRLIMNVEEGAQQILRDVTTTGIVRTRDGVVRRALRLTEGQPVDHERWAQSRRRMYDTNVFRQVDIEPVRLDQTPEDKAANIQPMRAIVRVIEYPAWRLRYGGQYREERTDEEATARTTQRGFGFLGDLQTQNLLGRALTSGVAVSLQPNRQATSVFAQNASFYGLPIRSNLFVFGVREDDETELFRTITDRRGTSFEQRWRPRPRIEAVWGYRYEWTHLYNPDPPSDPLAPEPLDEIVRTGRLRTALFVDRRDNVFNAAHGWFSSVSFDKAAPFLGADFPYTKMLLQQFYYQRLGPIVLATAGRIGLATSPENIDFDNRFFAGGGTTVRGYSEDSLGPRVGGQPTGGGALLILNQEVRFPIHRWFGGVAFVDAGNVWATKSELSISDLRFGYGLGLRVNTPFVVLRVDYGVPGSTIVVTRRANSITDGRWYFGIGHIF